MNRQDRISALKAAAKERILILDGSWGVMIQRRGLEEGDYRGTRFSESDYPGQMKGNNDILCLTRPGCGRCVDGEDAGQAEVPGGLHRASKQDVVHVIGCKRSRRSVCDL